MTDQNNFKRLQEEEELLFGARHDEQIRASLWGSLSFFRFVGHLVEMFIPRVFEFFIAAAQHEGQQARPAQRPTPAQGKTNDPGRIAPGSPDGGEAPRSDQPR